ncbi:MAG TPA: hypothetical protein VFS21_38170 [Roseiflexaceae bacterium]|nr:hypothetical protein [Roseiflexaceae bacterium]
MRDMHANMDTFHQDHVHLQEAKRAELREHRATNLQRLKDGLKKMGEADNKDYPPPLRDRGQGSYSMYTMNQRPDNDYDIDVAIIFRKDDLPATPEKAREHIESAFTTAGGNFSDPPKARTNAVTVWYADGYHIDFAVYREITDESGKEVTEHAGAEWKVRSPVEIRVWFQNEVDTQSPQRAYGASVKDKQMRRVVQLLKAFARSRDSWDLPGGMIISRLVSECYRADAQQDDAALYGTMDAIHKRLLTNCHVYDPIHTDQELTDRTKFLKQVERFRDRLKEALDTLQVLFNEDCTDAQARMAWHWVFQHDFWLDDEDGESSDTKEAVRAPSVLGIRRDIREAPPFA